MTIRSRTTSALDRIVRGTVAETLNALLDRLCNAQRYERSEADVLDRSVRTYESHRESFVQELVHFHACITEGIECRTPPEQARVDIELLTQMFLAAAP